MPTSPPPEPASTWNTLTKHPAGKCRCVIGPRWIRRSARSSCTSPTMRQGNARRGPRGRIPASQHSNESGRDEHGALSALQRRAQAPHHRSLAKASGEISFHCETSRNRPSAHFLNVQGTARCTDECRRQSGPSPSLNDEKGHAKIQRKIPSQRFDRIRLRPSSRHGQPPRSRGNLSAHRKWQVCGLQHVAIQPVRHKKQMDCIKSWFEIENSHWQKIFSSPQKLDETLSKRLDADKLVFSPRLNHLQMNALQSVQNSDSFRLQQLYQSIRNLEASLANKRRASACNATARFVSRLIRSRQPRTIQLRVKIGTAVESRSLRELQSLLFKLKRQYRTLHKRYSQIYGFSSYAHRNDQYQQMSQRASLSL